MKASDWGNAAANSDQLTETAFMEVITSPIGAIAFALIPSVDHVGVIHQIHYRFAATSALNKANITRKEELCKKGQVYFKETAAHDYDY